MATVQEAVRRLTIESTAKGVSETTTQLNALGKAHSGVAVESTKTEKATLSLEKRLNSIQRQYDANYRAEQALTKVTRELNAAEAQGLITTTRKNELLRLAAARHGQASAAAALQTRALAGLNSVTIATTAALTRMLPFAGGFAGLFTGAAFVRNTVEQDNAMAQLEAAIRSTGGAAGMTSSELAAMASSLQKTTTYGDETVMMAEGLLLTFTKIGRDVFPQALESVLNVSTAMHVGLREAAIQVGKALNDPIQGLGGLSRAGIQFTESQKAQIKAMVESGRQIEAQRLMLKELERQFGGSAAAARDTLGGALSGLKNAFGDLFEISNEGSSDLTKSINNLTDTLSDPKTIAAVQGFGTALFDAFSGAITLLRENPDLLPVLGAAALGYKFGGPIGAGLAALTVDAVKNTVKGTARGDQPFASDQEAIDFYKRRDALNATAGAFSDRFGDSGPTGGVTAGDVLAAYKRKTTPGAGGGLTEDQIREAERMQQAFEKALQSSAKQTEALRIQAETFGMTAVEAARFTKEQELLNAATENHINLAAIDKATGLTNLQAIEAQADAYAAATAQVERLKAAQEASNFLAQTTFDAFRSLLPAIQTGNDALDRFITSLEDAVLQAALLGNGPLAGIFGSSGSGGLLGSLFGAFIKHDGGVVGSGGPARFVHPAYFDGAARFATGGIAGIGPDEVPIIAHRNEEIIRRDDPRHRYNQGSSSDGGTISVPLSVTFNGPIDASMRSYVSGELARMRQEILTAVPNVVEAKRQSSPGYLG